MPSEVVFYKEIAPLNAFRTADQFRELKRRGPKVSNNAGPSPRSIANSRTEVKPRASNAMMTQRLAPPAPNPPPVSPLSQPGSFFVQIGGKTVKSVLVAFKTIRPQAIT